MCTFSSFVDFSFIFWRVSCEGGFSLFLNFNLCTGCQGVKMYFWVLWSVWIYSCRTGKDGGFIRRDRSFHLPSINLAKARDAWLIPLVKSSCLCGCPQGNRLGTISSSNLQGFLRLLSFGKVWKENNDPLVCSTAHPMAAHSRGIFFVEWLMVKTRLIRLSVYLWRQRPTSRISRVLRD